MDKWQNPDPLDVNLNVNLNIDDDATRPALSGDLFDHTMPMLHHNFYQNVTFPDMNNPIENKSIKVEESSGVIQHNLFEDHVASANQHPLFPNFSFAPHESFSVDHTPIDEKKKEEEQRPSVLQSTSSALFDCRNEMMNPSLPPPAMPPMMPSMAQMAQQPNFFSNLPAFMHNQQLLGRHTGQGLLDDPCTTSDSSKHKQDRPSVVQPTPSFMEGMDSMTHNFFSHLPFTSSFGFPDFDYRFHEELLNQRHVTQQNDLSTIRDAKSLNHYGRGFADNDLLFPPTMFPYGVPNFDMSTLVANKQDTKDSEANDRRNRRPDHSTEMYIPPHPDVNDLNRFGGKFGADGKPHNCAVCESTQANGLHFGAKTCAACAAFFRRSISDDKKYQCKKSQRCNNVTRDGTGYRKICRSCRLDRCLKIGMQPDNVQHKRARRDTPIDHISGLPKPLEALFDQQFYHQLQANRNNMEHGLH